MKQLICLISTKRKEPGQAAKEAWEAYEKFQKTGEQTIEIEEEQK